MDIVAHVLRLAECGHGYEVLAGTPGRCRKTCPQCTLPKARPEALGECKQCGLATYRGKTGPLPDYCSKECRRRSDYLRHRDRRGAEARAETAAKARPVIKCGHCGELKEVRKTSTRFCSSGCATRFRRANHDGSCSTNDCHRTAEARGMCIVCWRRWARASGREKNPGWDERRKSNYQKRRALKLQLPADDIRPSDVYERDAWVCGLCAWPVDRTLAYPDPDSPSLDHILPLSKGGHHTLENTQLAHLRCNIRKGARVEDLADAMPA